MLLAVHIYLVLEHEVGIYIVDDWFSLLANAKNYIKIENSELQFDRFSKICRRKR